MSEFLRTSDSEIVGELTRGHAHHGFRAQLRDATEAWLHELQKLRATALELADLQQNALKWNILLEFVIPRKESRIDVVLLTGSQIILLELKQRDAGKEAFVQAEEYALLLHFFHRPSSRRRIVPIVVSESFRGPRSAVGRQKEFAFTDTAAYWIDSVKQCSWDELPSLLLAISAEHSEESPIDAATWDAGEYFPVPSIIDAARSLQAGLSIREIAHSRAAEHDVAALSSVIFQKIEEAKQLRKHVICFITGVPGSGKTLVGLNLAFQSRGDGEALHFMSGNGPLVMVMQALFKDFQHRVRGLRSTDAEIQAKTLIEDVHLFAKNYTKTAPEAVPSNHVVIFDEAQRAWNYEQSKRKFKRDSSEPTMFLRIMERHRDWAVIIALVGGGQEINSGEAGLAEWGRSLAASQVDWQIFASPEVLHGGTAVAGTSLLEDDASRSLSVRSDSQLHLRVSVRTLQAEKYAEWVNAVIAGEATAAALLRRGEFPVFLTRNLAELRRRLRQQQVGMSRVGLIGSSKAARIRAEGLEPDGSFHAEYKWDRWYLAPETDVRSSDRLEVFATEFEIQGLELDWVGLLWGGDMVWEPKEQRWFTRKLLQRSVTKWSKSLVGDARTHRLNSYRVLLTRARQGIIIYVPGGDADDPTRSPRELDATAEFLLRCGVMPVEQMSSASHSNEANASETLF